jgi:hypothetical protein
VDLLTAVNNVLPFMQENPVTSLTIKHPTVALLVNKMDAARMLLLTDGYWFNDEIKTFYLTPDGKVAVPNNLLSLYPTDKSLNYEIRGGFIYDLDNSTFTIAQSFTANITTELAFEDLPLFAALAVQWRGATEAYAGDFTVDTTAKLLKQNELEAQGLLDREHLRKRNYSAMRSNPGFRYLNALRS